MAQGRFIQYCEGESWKEISNSFRQWLEGNAHEQSIGWSEGDTLKVSENIKLYCFHIPDHHGSNAGLFEEWAKTTKRLYGIENNGKVVFPGNPDLVVTLPEQQDMEKPRWLK